MANPKRKSSQSDVCCSQNEICYDADIAQLASEQGISAGVKLYSLDEIIAKRLWTLSEEMAGITFNVD